MTANPLIDNAGAAATLLSLLGNEKRLVIISHLLEGEMSVGAIAEKVSLSQSALSQHLAKLRSIDIVETRRDRQMIYYSCNSAAVRQLIGTLDGIFNGADEVYEKSYAQSPVLAQKS
ncbi:MULTISPECIES: ArsR/SmtB family transcription factor [unclassified Mesorhizobium]|uniref:ArsR/SmtB family transcription factor n=1 Tax=unclassified Mesorhizobium TaxID=325217 RepID=UPI0030154A75